MRTSKNKLYYNGWALIDTSTEPVQYHYRKEVDNMRVSLFVNEAYDISYLEINKGGYEGEHMSYMTFLRIQGELRKLDDAAL